MAQRELSKASTALDDEREAVSAVLESAGEALGQSGHAVTQSLSNQVTESARACSY